MNSQVQGRAYGGRTAADRIAERRARLMACGIPMLGSRGYRGTTVEAVCEDAGLTKRYFYESFESMEAFVLAAYDEIMGEIRSLVLGALTPDAAPVDRLLEQLDRYLAWMEQHPDRARIQLLEIRGVSTDVDERSRDLTAQIAAETAALLVAGTDLESAPYEAQVLGNFVIGGGLKVAGQWFLTPDRPPRSEVIEAGRAILTRTLPGLLGRQQA